MTDSAAFRVGTILLADTRVAALRRTSDLLRRAGYEVIEAGAFDEAKRVLAHHSPSLLISGLRLGAFNGLHLVHLARLTRPELNAIILAASADAVLQVEAESVGASLLVEPVLQSALLSLISQMLEGGGTIGPSCSATERRHASERRVAATVPELHRDRRLT